MDPPFSLVNEEITLCHATLRQLILLSLDSYLVMAIQLFRVFYTFFEKERKTIYGPTFSVSNCLAITDSTQRPAAYVDMKEKIYNYINYSPSLSL